MESNKACKNGPNACVRRFGHMSRQLLYVAAVSYLIQKSAIMISGYEKGDGSL